MRTHAFVLATAGLLLIGCAGDPAVLSPPPVANDAEPWPTLRWSEAVVPPSDPKTQAYPVAVAHGPTGFVAVGFRDEGPERTGLLWWSADGAEWIEPVDQGSLDGTDLVDVAAAPMGYAAIGQTSGAIHTEFLVSADGQHWRRADPPPGSAEAYGGQIAASAIGFLAAGGDPTVAALWRSPDGGTWEALPGDDVTRAGVSDLATTPDGWVALIDGTDAPTIAHSVDGTAWSESPLPVAGDERAYAVAPSERGWLIRGGAGSCGPFGMGSCPEGPANWWSEDGTAWGRMPLMPPLDAGPVPEPATGPRGFVIWSAGQLWASPDGWTWDAIGGPGDPTFAPAAIALEGDRIVLVGSTTAPDGVRTWGRAFIAEPG